MSKGHAQRPLSVSKEDFDKNYEEIFKKKAIIPATPKDKNETKTITEEGSCDGLVPIHDLFECGECGCTEIEEVMIGVTLTSGVAEVEGDNIYYSCSEWEGGTIDRYQCVGCASVLCNAEKEPISNPRALAAYLNAGYVILRKPSFFYLEEC